MTIDELYKVTKEFAQTHELTGYGNGFDRKGKSYFSYLLTTRPDFKQWVINHYPVLSNY